MKKQFKNYSIIWLVEVIIFSVIVFIVRMTTNSNYSDATFFISYFLVLLAFAGQIGLAYKFFKEENAEKVFLNMPLLTLSKSCVTVSFIIGTILMVIPFIPYFIAAIVSVIILGFYAIQLIKADSAAAAVNEVDKKVAAQTEFIKDMTVKAQNVVAKAKTDDGKAIAEKVFEAIRYSNKSSHGGLDEVEGKISANFTVFADAISSGDDVLAASVGDQLIKLAEERNNLAKANKN